MDSASAMLFHMNWELQSYTPSHSSYLQRNIAAIGQGRKPNHLLTPVLAWLSQHSQQCTPGQVLSITARYVLPQTIPVMIQKLSILAWGKKKSTFSFQRLGSEEKLDTDEVSRGLSLLVSSFP